MLRRMPARVLMELKYLDDIEPFGDRRGDFQAASICATLANVILGRKGTTVFQPRDFLPTWGGDAPAAGPAGPAPAASARGRRQTWQEQKMIAMMFASGGKQQRKKRP